MVGWWGNHYVPLDRLLNALARRGRGLAAGPGGPRPAREASPGLFGAWTAVRGAVLALSLLLEPVAERVLPPRWAEHGVFVFRKV
jgi:hypothetical protein